MPNTLAHLGLQALLTRAVIRGSNLGVIGAGVVVPDVPWILQRAVTELVPGVDPYELRLYAIAQATLIVSLLPCAALAMVAERPRRVFTVLALNVVLHLLLDAVQTKWANGVHFWAPATWQLSNLRWFWPESPPTYVLTAMGVVVAAWGCMRRWNTTRVFARPRSRRIIAAALLVATYLTIPVAMRDGPRRADNHFAATMSAPDRTGAYVEFDRNRHRVGIVVDSLVALGGERLLVRPRVLSRDATISARGRFVDHSTVTVHEFHDHSGWPRDALSYAGLMLIGLLWVWRRPPGTTRPTGAEATGGTSEAMDPRRTTGR